MMRVWGYSLIEYRENPGRDGGVPLGVVIFTGNPEGPIVARLAERAKVPDQARASMAARALLNRLVRERPLTPTDVRRFAAKEANEVRLSDPRQTVWTGTSSELLRKLSEVYLEGRMLTCSRNRPDVLGLQRATALAWIERAPARVQLQEA